MNHAEVLMDFTFDALERSPVFTVTRQIEGYKHTVIEGTYTGFATSQDVAQYFYHMYFGGREASVDGKGNFRVIRHND